MNRKHWLIFSFAALVFVLMICLILFIMEMILNFKAYNPAQGIAGSPWVGFENLTKLVTSLQFSRVIKNTLLFNVLFALMFFAIAAGVGYIVTALPRRVKEVAALFCALPVFLPTEIYGSWLIHLLGSPVFVNPGAMRFLLPFFCAVKYAGIPIMVTYMLNEMYVYKDYWIPLKVAGLFSIASLAFIVNGFYSMTNVLYNPMTYETMDMADNFVYRSSVMNMNTGSNAMGLIQTIITLVSVAILAVAIRFLFYSTFTGEKKEEVTEKISGKIVSSLIAIAIFAVIYFLPYILKGRSFDTGLLGGSLNLGYSIFVYLVLSLISALIATVLAALMSGAFVSTRRNIRLAAGILLALITILTVRPINYSNYLLIRSMGLVNTGYAIILASLFSAVAVWAMVALLNAESQITTRSVFFAMVGLFLIQTAVNYGNVIPPLLYLHNARISPVLTFRQLQMGIQTIGDVSERASAYGVVGLGGFVTALPSLLLFLAANVILPKGKLFAIIAAGVKS